MKALVLTEVLLGPIIIPTSHFQPVGHFQACFLLIELVLVQPHNTLKPSKSFLVKTTEVIKNIFLRLVI